MSRTRHDAPRLARLHLIAAIASNRVIGAAGKLPWHLPEDLKHFKALTSGHPVIMGRRTWESLGKALPGRENIVVTRNRDYEAPGASIASSLAAALALCADAPTAFIIGGSQLYAEALGCADALELTEIQCAFDGDARFPDFDRSDWLEVERRPQTAAGGLRFDFVRYERTC